MDDIEIFETAEQISWDINPINEKKDSYEGTNYREEWHIHRGWKLHVNDMEKMNIIHM